MIVNDIKKDNIKLRMNSIVPGQIDDSDGSDSVCRNIKKRSIEASEDAIASENEGKNEGKQRSTISKRSVRFICPEPEGDNNRDSKNRVQDLEVDKMEIKKDKLLIRTKSGRKSEESDSIILPNKKKPRKSIQKHSSTFKRAGLKKRLQSVYKHFDIITDDQTACDMRDMVSRFDNLSKECDHCVYQQTFWALFGLFVNIVQREFDYYTEDTFITYLIVLFLRSCVSLSTLAMIYYLSRYHENQVSFCSLNKVFMAWENLWTTYRNYSPFLWDVFVYICHEPPFVNIATNVAISREEPILVNNVFALLMFARIFLIIRFNSATAFRGGTKILGIWHNFQFGLGFTMRNMLYTHPIRAIIPVFIGLVTIAWYCLNTCERYAEDGLMRDGLDSLWVLCVTITTVGYGDAYPATQCGRFTLVGTAVASQLLIAVVISTFHQKLHLMPFESRMVEFLAHAKSFKKLRTYAADVIKHGWKLSKARRKAGLAGRRQTYRGKELKTFTDSVFLFERHRNTVQAYDRRYRNDQLIRSMLEDISRQCEEAKLYYAAANQIAAATGRALKMDSSRSKDRRVDGSLKPFVEREYTIIDERQSTLRGDVNKLKSNQQSSSNNNIKHKNKPLSPLMEELPPYKRVEGMPDTQNTISDLEDSMNVAKQNSRRKNVSDHSYHNNTYHNTNNNNSNNNNSNSNNNNSNKNNNNNEDYHTTQAIKSLQNMVEQNAKMISTILKKSI